jgi:zinc/manganese transport system permease protein
MKSNATPTATSTIMLQYEFMRTAFAAAAIVAVVAGCVGYFLVLRGQTFAGHALAHVGFTGATGAVLIGASPLAGLVLLTVAAGLGMGLLGDRLANRDVAIGLVLALALGLGLLFLHFFTGFATQATSLLFGNVLAVSATTVWMLLALGVLCLGVLAVISRPLLFASLQPELADAKGVHLKWLSAVFLAIVALATAECAQVVGVLLVFALMVGPAATAQRLTTKIASGVLLSALLALIEGWMGLTLAFYTDWPTSFWITAISTVFYLFSISPVVRFVQIAREPSV